MPTNLLSYSLYIMIFCFLQLSDKCVAFLEFKFLLMTCLYFGAFQEAPWRNKDHPIKNVIYLECFFCSWYFDIFLLNFSICLIISVLIGKILWWFPGVSLGMTLQFEHLVQLLGGMTLIQKCHWHGKYVTLISQTQEPSCVERMNNAVRILVSNFLCMILLPCLDASYWHFGFLVMWELQTLCNAYCGENYSSNDFGVLEKVRDTILRMTYYW